MSCEHFNFSCAQPSNKLGNDSLAHAEGDSVGHVSQVWLKSGRDVDCSQLSLEASDFEAVGSKLLTELLLSSAAGIELLAGGEGSAVYGGDEPIGDGVDCFIDVGVGVQEDFSGSRGY